jgi:N-acetylglucosaminyl-diphospho-decaprenol L-rhamnosyltransferase
MISAVVVAYDSAECIASCLTSVRKVLPDAELVVVDNASSDETVRLATFAVEDVRLVRLEENVGFGRACNIGAEVASRPHVLFLNPDTRVASLDRNALAQLLARRPFGLAAPALRDEPDRLRAERHWLSDVVSHTAGMLRPRELRRRGRHRSFGDSRRAWVGGAMLLVARDEFLTLGGFDPRFFLYYEDRDLSHRYRKEALPITATGALQGTHEGGSSSAHDGLHANSTVWGLLGWIQYVSIYSGSESAHRCARLTLMTLQAIRAALRPLEAAGSGRARRKARQLERVLHLLAWRARCNDNRFCPDALRVIRELTR